MSNAHLKIALVGRGWMNQSICMTGGVPLVRPFESEAEARDAVQSIRRELLASPKIARIEGLTRRDFAFGDFAAVTDVRLDYVVQTYGEAMGLFGPTRTTTTAESVALEFSDPDSQAVVDFDDEEED